MFNLDHSDCSDEYCEHDECGCDCSDDDEAYLDQDAARNFDKGEGKRKTEGLVKDEDLLEYNLKGIDIPVKMSKSGDEVEVNREVQADMEAESPFPATLIKTVLTNPIITTPLTSQNIISANSEAFSIFKKHKKQKKSRRNIANSDAEGHDDLGTATPRMRPPPSTPFEHDTFPSTLSTPHLPVFHHYTDQSLFEQYLVDRAKDPTFDLQTSKIRKHLLDAKIERGGIRHLEESEYSVDLASREDAARFQRMAVQRRRGMTETESVRSFSLEQPIVMLQHPPEYSDRPGEAGSTLSAPAKATHKQRIEPSDKKGNASGGTATKKRSSVNRKLPVDFDFIGHVTKYTTSGSMRHQHQRTVVEDENGTKTVLKTWIEITQEIYVPHAKHLGWEDVKAAIKEEKAAKREAKAKANAKAKGTEQDEGGAEEDGNIEAKQDPGNDSADLLGAIARTKGTGKLSRGVSLARYLDIIKKDVEQTLEANGGKPAEAGEPEGDDAGEVDTDE